MFGFIPQLPPLELTPKTVAAFALIAVGVFLLIRAIGVIIKLILCATLIGTGLYLLYTFKREGAAEPAKPTSTHFINSLQTKAASFSSVLTFITHNSNV